MHGCLPKTDNNKHSECLRPKTACTAFQTVELLNSGRQAGRQKHLGNSIQCDQALDLASTVASTTSKRLVSSRQADNLFENYMIRFASFLKSSNPDNGRPVQSGSQKHQAHCLIANTSLFSSIFLNNLQMVTTLVEPFHQR